MGRRFSDLSYHTATFPFHHLGVPSQFFGDPTIWFSHENVSTMYCHLRVHTSMKATMETHPNQNAILMLVIYIVYIRYSELEAAWASHGLWGRLELGLEGFVIPHYGVDEVLLRDCSVPPSRHFIPLSRCSPYKVRFTGCKVLTFDRGMAPVRLDYGESECNSNQNTRKNKVTMAHHLYNTPTFYMQRPLVFGGGGISVKSRSPAMFPSHQRGT